MKPAKSSQNGHFPKCKVVFFFILIETLTLGSALCVSIYVNDIFSPNLKSENLIVEENVSCISLESIGADNLTLIWRYPDTNMGDMRGRDLTGMRSLSFSVRGENGDENVDFAVGRQQGKFMDSTSKSLGRLEPPIKNNNWTTYSINLEDEDLSNIRAGFVCTLIDEGKIYLRDIKYETY
jgi:hypothetical protein